MIHRLLVIHAVRHHADKTLIVSMANVDALTNIKAIRTKAVVPNVAQMLTVAVTKHACAANVSIHVSEHVVRVHCAK